MDHDDATIGRVLSRREALGFFGAAGITLFGTPFGLRLPAGRRLPACIVRPEQTEGPYFVDVDLNRSDIRPDPRSGEVPGGVQLDLAFEVFRIAGGECTPLADALVDVWQCDALGVYSGVRDTAGRFDTVGRRFLRGHQRTDAEGRAAFITIYPGWYEGRTVHAHFKIRTPARRGGSYDFTSQLYFDDGLTDRVLQTEPYAQKGRRTVRNPDDGIFRRGGEELLLAVSQREGHYAASFAVGLQIDDEDQPTSR